jgi:hypothetical protein
MERGECRCFHQVTGTGSIFGFAEEPPLLIGAWDVEAISLSRSILRT